jgi:DNA-binding NtrC family response regulator
VRKKGTKILIVDDEIDMAENIQLILDQAGHGTIVETERPKAMGLVEREQPDLVITDLRMPEVDGLTLVERIKASQPEIPVIVLTGYASIDSAVEVMKRGANDYLSKPFSPEELLLRITKALSWTELTEENRLLRERIKSISQHDVIIGESPALLEILDLVKKVAPTDARVLLAGESGTGKELMARCIHRHSLRQNAPFLAINCGAFSENLLESELFGHERGAFTGAVTSKKGIFDVAHGGTLFLDEICDTSLGFQTKLLRVVQEGEFLRVGGTRPQKIDARIISATNRDPKDRIEKGLFREDLFYRISVVQIQMPNLRSRPEDVPRLSAYFADLYARQINKKIRGIQPEAKEMLAHYAWPGNIRELQNVIERAVIMANDDGAIEPKDLPADLLKKPAEPPEPMEDVRSAERELLLRVLRQCQWNRTQAAKTLGIGRRTLYDKMARLGISLRRP